MGDSNWTEWSKFVLISIQNIQKSLSSLVENISTLQSDIKILKIKDEQHDDINKDVDELKTAVSGIKEDVTELKTKSAVNGVKLAGIIAAGTTAITLLIQLALKLLF